ncbi:uncharacterized protein LOC107458892 [Arachis duranensis]|uniref:Uncharacterized protein LOC107458892 n=1 Tax=Arachis duranensis TaxID=130453 RepID=A0A6P4B5P0_ARADU|nr:uncharacterized protein LOC107458892 [Arachis duranensis]
MALTDDYEPVRASLLHQNPLPSLEDALPRLKFEETRLGLLHSKSETVFAATDRKEKIYRNCNRPGHSFSDCPSIECRNSKWYFDSGCFNHMSPLHHLFPSLSPIPNAPYVNTANGSLLHATHHGIISQSNIHLSDAYFIPKLNFNLISVGQLVELSFDVTFSISGCRVQDRQMGKIIGTGCKVRRLFELENLHVPSTNLCAASSPSTLHLWHRRLAHNSLGKLRPLISTGVSCRTAK